MKKQALIIGIDEYSDENITRLRCAEQDAWRMKCLLGDCGFEVASLIGRNATRHDINTTVDRLCATLVAGDLFLFYFAGHGNDDAQGHHRLLTWGARRVDLDSGDEGDTIPVRSLERRTRGHGPMRLFILDACRAPLEHDRASSATALAPGTVRDLGLIVRDSGAAVPLTILSSCGPEQRAHEIVKLSAGVFTGAIAAVVAERRRDGLGLVLPADLQALTMMTSALLLQYNIPGQQAPCCETTGHPVILLAPRERAAPAVPTEVQPNPAAAPPRVAVLEVVSDPPGGQVLIDGGHWRGTTPFTVEGFPQDEHHYRATLENEKISSTFQVNAYEVRLELDFPQTKKKRREHALAVWSVAIDSARVALAGKDWVEGARLLGIERPSEPLPESLTATVKALLAKSAELRRRQEEEEAERKGGFMSRLVTMPSAVKAGITFVLTTLRRATATNTWPFTVAALITLLTLMYIPWQAAAWLIGINGAMFLLYAYDKQQAASGGRRVSETGLVLLALAGGSPAAFLAQWWFLRHKPRDPLFRRTLVVILAVQLLWLLASVGS